MSKKSFARLIRIVTGTFGTDKDDGFSFGASLTRFEVFVHFWVLVTGSFIRNRLLARAAALSYTTLLSLVPVLAVAVGVTGYFLKSEGKEQIERFINQMVERTIPAITVQSVDYGPFLPVTNTAATDEVTNAVPERAAAGLEAGDRLVAAQKLSAEYLHTFIQKTYSGTMGVTGLLALLLTAILTIVSVENALNDVWGVVRGRSWPSRIAIYWTTLTLGSLLLAAAALLATGPHFQKTRALFNTLPFAAPLLSGVFPWLLICLVFASLYKLLPNTRVQMSAALTGGVVAGAGWQAFNSLGFLLASRAAGWNKIYGGLALVPLFMFGLYVVWAIVLFGAQVAYAFQNRESYLQEKLAENVNQRGREFVALRLMTCIGQRFHRGQPPPTVLELSRELGIPSKLVQQVLQTLLAARLIVEISGAESAYTPARPLDAINGHHILLAMRATQGQELVTREEPVREEVLGEFARIQAAEKEAASSVTMLALVNRAQARLQIAPPVVPQTAPPAIEPAGATETVPSAEKLAPVTLAASLKEPMPPVMSEVQPPAQEAVQELKPTLSPDISSATPTAESAADHEQSFPL